MMNPVLDYARGRRALRPLLRSLTFVAELIAKPFRKAADFCDMCGRPLRSKRNLQERCGPWSGADMCAAFDAAHTPRAQMGVRGSGPIQAHALEALVAKLVILIPSLDRCAIPLL